MNVLVKENETKEILITDNSSIDFIIEDNGILLLKFALFKDFKEINIKGILNKNSILKTNIADFSSGKGKLISYVKLNKEGAKATWDLASLATNDDKKEFDISFIHNEKNTYASMNNYGVALNNSRLVFSGVNYIKKGAKKSNTAQNAKIIVFDKDASGKANPVLRIDENDVLASHAAIVGRLNDEHLFYLKSRGLNEIEAKALIVQGYLKPIGNNFNETIKSEIDNKIMEKCHV